MMLFKALNSKQKLCHCRSCLIGLEENVIITAELQNPTSPTEGLVTALQSN